MIIAFKRIIFKLLALVFEERRVFYFLICTFLIDFSEGGDVVKNPHYYREKFDQKREEVLA